MMFIRTALFPTRVTPDKCSQLVESENENIIWCNRYKIFKIPSRRNADCFVTAATYNFQRTLKKYGNKTFYTLNHII